MSKRNAEQTRERILQASYEEIYQNGYQGMRIDAILEKTQLAKGALYHHFPNKQAIGFAVIDEVIKQSINDEFIALLSAHDDPLTGICHIFRQAAEQMPEEEVKLGCPLNNLSQEMAGIDEGFKSRLNAIYCHWNEAIAEELEAGQKAGIVQQQIDPYSTAMFIISALQGVMGTAKCLGEKPILISLINELCRYVESLRVKQD